MATHRKGKTRPAASRFTPSVQAAAISLTPENSVILVGIGSNLPHPEAGPPEEICAAALDALDGRGVAVETRSRWYLSAPVPRSSQPDFVNGVASVRTALGPEDLLAVLHDIEAEFGRVRSVPDAARTLDLDLLAYRGLVRAAEVPPLLPHPRMAERAFVLLPLRDVAPDWRHPASGRDVSDLIGRLPPGRECRPLRTAAGRGDVLA